MTAYRIADKSPAEIRRSRTIWVRDLKTGEAICNTLDQGYIESYLGHIVNHVKIDDNLCEGECEGVEIVMLQVFHGEAYTPFAWIDEGGHFHTDEINEALFPMRQREAANV